jgi:amino acid adenylation domain-containing protein/non-ribosomal peptide synthase protein (TIGR01720 family)
MQKKYSDTLLMAAARHEDHLDYWKKTLSSRMVRVGFPNEFAANRQPPEGELRYETFVREISGQHVVSMLEFCRMSDHTLHIFLSAAVLVLLHGHSGQNDIVIGTPIYKQGEEGDYINPVVPIRVQLEESLPFRKLLGHTRGAIVEALEHQNYPVEMVADQLGLPEETFGFSLFDVVVMMDAIHSTAFVDRVKPSIIVSFQRRGQNLSVTWTYNPSLYGADTIGQFNNRLGALLKLVLERKDVSVEECRTLTDEDRQNLLHHWNQTAHDYPENRTMAEMFAKVAEANPQAAAFVFEGDDKRRAEELRFDGLWSRSGMLAALLQKIGVGPDSIVAVMAERSIQLMVALAAIIRAGGAFLPIDPSMPQKRLQYLMKDSDSAILLTQPEFLEKASGDWETIDIDNIEDDNLSPRAPEGLLPRHLFYVIYTSGTTGKPKGVCLTHRNLMNYTSWFVQEADVTKDDRTMHTASYAFDFIYTMILPTFLTGSSHHIVTRETNLSPGKFVRYIEQHRISVIKCTPSLYNVVINSEEFEAADLSSLRVALFGGEPINVRDLKRMHDCFPHIRVMNHYGPTETTIGSCAMFIDFDKIHGYMANPTIGQPIFNTNLLVLDRQRRLVPPLAWGELFIGGDSVARGYLNRPELNLQRFVANPITGEGVMYATGDVARWRNDGTVELGERIDDQIKIRGYRIELGEIEKQLLQNNGVKEVFVMARDNGSGVKSLVAYVVPSNQSLDMAELKHYLSESVPEYMIPHHFVKLDRMPLTQHHKVDRSRLPQPQGSDDAAYRPPENEIQNTIADVMSSVLGVKKIGLYDNFFEIGGDSIKAVMVSARLRKHGWNLEVRDIFSQQILEKMAEAARPVKRLISQAEVTGDVALTPVQRRFFRHIHSGRNQFNQAVMLFSKDGFDEAITHLVLEKIMEHHDVLRMIYHIEDGSVKQQNRAAADAGLHFEIVDIAPDSDIETAVASECERVQAGMDIQRGIMFRTALFKTAAGHHLLLAVHHLVMDGISWRIILEDFAEGYKLAARNLPVVFTDKTDSFKDWARRLTEYASGEGGRDHYSVLSEMDYWHGIVTSPNQPLPFDFETAEQARRFSDCNTVTVKLPAESTSLLLGDVHRAYNTHINDILLSALWRAVSRWTGQSTVMIDLEGHGREEIIEEIDINRTIGWFSTHFPVALTGGGDDLAASIKNVKDTLRRIPNNGIGYGILKYLTPEEYKQNCDFSMQPPILFNYMGEFGQGSGERDMGMSPIKPAGAIGPDVERIYPLDVLAMIAGKELSISFTYSVKEFKTAAIQELAGDYIIDLTAIVNHCCGKEDTEYTPTDFDYNGLSVEELDGLQDDLLDIE